VSRYRRIAGLRPDDRAAPLGVRRAADHRLSDSEYLDSNYSGILIIWDRMFGTFAAETQKPTYGSTTQINSSNLLDV
jgi:sterol desaturase/sphingolipid hydroxylase (fatty acid hydroxylase superfamily)